MVINANTAMPNGGELRVGSRFDPVSDNIVVTIEDTVSGYHRTAWKEYLMPLHDEEGSERCGARAEHLLRVYKGA